jgi:hypothetical protein
VPRLLVLVVLAGLLVGGFAAERMADPEAPDPVADRLDRLVPVVADDSVLGATWYCAAGSTTPDGPADHTVVLTNTGDADRRATVAAVAGRDDPVTTEVEVPASTTARVELAELVEAPAVAALVEVDGGGVAVGHELVGPTGADTGPCASAPSSEWYLAWGDTSRDARYLLALFNPFPDDAVLDLEFATDEGARVPSAFEGLVVPGRSVVVADVGAEVTRRDQVAASIVARTGRVVAERIQVLDGSAGREGLAVDLAVPRPLEGWVVPAGVVGPDRVERLVIANPGDRTAEIDVELRPADPERFGGIEPFELSVPAGEALVLDLPDEPRVADVALDQELAYEAVVRSLNGVGVVVERVTARPPDADAPGLAVVSGTPLVAGRWVGPPVPATVAGARLVLTNPSADTIVLAELGLLTADGAAPLGADEVEVPAAGRIEVELAELADLDDLAGAAVVVTADGPVTAQVRGTTTDPGRFDAIGVPVADGFAVAPGLELAPTP